MFFTLIWALFYAVFLLLTLPVLGLCYLAKVFCGKSVFARFVYLSTRFWGKLTIMSTGSTVEVHGLENIPQDESLCFVANHQSMFDIPLLVGWLGIPVGFIAREELKKVPIINLWIVAMNSVFINRKNPRHAIEAINAGAEIIKKGQSMVIFPEGTRSKDSKIAEFKAGSIRLATVSGAQLSPVTITGTRDVYEAKKLIRKSKLVLVIHKPISHDEVSRTDKKDILVKLHKIISSSYY